MTANMTAAPVSHPDRFFIGGAWVAPSSDDDDRRDRRRHRGGLRSACRRHRPTTSPARSAAARTAFDEGPWPGLTHAERAGYLRALGAAVHGARRRAGRGLARGSRARSTPWPSTPAMMAAGAFESYAALADTFPFEEEAQPSMGGGFGLLVREPVGCRRRHHPVERAARSSSRTRSGPRCWPGARSCSSCRPRRPARATWSPRRRSRSGSRPACSTSSPPTARCRSCSCATRASTRSRSPGRPRPGARSRHSAVSASPVARSSSGASRPRSCSTTPTSPPSRRRSPAPSAS